MANAARALAILDINANPLGSGQGEANLSTPFNAVLPAARVYIRNHSASVKRQFVKVSVSWKRGANEALRADAELRKIYNISQVREDAQSGIDMNVYGEKVEPVMFSAKWNSKIYTIPPAADDKSEPPRVQVPEGVWDLLMGNYERMHSADPAIRADESMRLAVTLTKRNSAILFETVDGERTQRQNPFGFVEVERVTESMEPINPDSEFLTALEMVEG
jgi:hypothetical protein